MYKINKYKINDWKFLINLIIKLISAIKKIIER